LADESGADGALLQGAAAGDERAFAILVRRHIRAATLLAAQLLGDRDDADDVVQDAFGVVYRQALRFDPARPFEPWFFAIVRRLAANRRIRQARRARLLRLWGHSAPTPSDSSPSGRAEAVLDVAAARGAMTTLPPMQRACFELVAMRDVPVAQVAAMYGISASTVRQHVFRARAALREVIDGSD